jgi:ABC-2 type transport system ATP-binding protein
MKTTKPAPRLSGGEAVLEAHNLTKIYAGSDRPALSDLFLNVTPGEVIGLLGPNGAGKTTAISILSTLMTPSRGSVRIAGMALAGNTPKVRGIIGLVPQEVALYERLTPVENLRFFGRLHGLGGERLERRIQAALALVALEPHAEKRIALFSGGMQRRCNLAAGLLHRPRLLFCDEPTVGIDAQSRNLILERLRKLASEGVSLIYTTHYMEEAQALCDRIVILDDGRTITEGRPSDLLAAATDCRNLGELYLKLTGRELRD